MKIILATCGNSYCGCDSEDAFCFDEDTKADWIESEIYEWACENAESFAYVHFGWEESYTDEDYDDYLENYVTYDWHEATYDEYLEWCDNWNIEPAFKEE